MNTIGIDFEKPMVALASFPGSGNTWLRYLLQQITGIWTGSIYVDPVLAATGFIAEGIANNSVLFVKTHQHDKQDMFSFGKAVLVVRDPAEAILSDFNWRNAGHLGHAGLHQFNGTNEKGFINANESFKQ